MVNECRKREEESERGGQREREGERERAGERERENAGQNVRLEASATDSKAQGGCHFQTSPLYPYPPSLTMLSLFAFLELTYNSSSNSA